MFPVESEYYASPLTAEQCFGILPLMNGGEPETFTATPTDANAGCNNQEVFLEVHPPYFCPLFGEAFSFAQQWRIRDKFFVISAGLD